MHVPTNIPRLFAKFYVNQSMYWNVIAIFPFWGCSIISIGLGNAELRKPVKVKNRNNIPIHAPIYIKFGKETRYIGRNMPIKL